MNANDLEAAGRLAAFVAEYRIPVVPADHPLRSTMRRPDRQAVRVRRLAPIDGDDVRVWIVTDESGWVWCGEENGFAAETVPEDRCSLALAELLAERVASVVLAQIEERHRAA